MDQMAAQTPQELLGLLQGSGDAGGQPELKDLMDAVQRMQAGLPNSAAGDEDQALVFPDPGFVVKTLDEQGRKVFINVCSSPKVGMPGGWEGGKIPEDVRRQLDGLGSISGGTSGSGSSGGLLGEPDSDAANELLRFPLSMAKPREDSDHRGEGCTVIDVVLNSELLHHAATFRPLKLYLIQLVLGWAQQKNGLQLDPHYKLPKMRYKGDAPQPQYVRLDRSQQAQQAQRQLVSEVEPPGGEAPAFPLLAAGSKRPGAAGAARPAAPTAQQAAAAPGRAGAAGQPAEPPAVPSRAAVAEPHPVPAAVTGRQQQQAQQQQLQHSVEYLGRPVHAVQVTVRLPEGAAAAAAGGGLAEAAVEVAGHSVHIAAPGWLALAVELPFAVAAAGGTAQLAPGGRELRLTLPYRPFQAVYKEVQQSAPHKFGAMGLTTSSLLELD